MTNTKQRAKDILEEYSNGYSQVDLEELAKYLDQIKSEAYKEFAELCKKEVPPYSRAIIDILLKEMG